MPIILAGEFESESSCSLLKVSKFCTLLLYLWFMIWQILPAASINILSWSFPCFHFLILSPHMYHGDAWRGLLDTAGTMTPGYDPEAMASLNKFVDQLPSVFNQVFVFFDKINQVFLLFIHIHVHGILERTNPWLLIQVWLFLCDYLHSANLVMDLLQHSLVQLHDVKYLWLLKWAVWVRLWVRYKSASL